MRSVSVYLSVRASIPVGYALHVKMRWITEAQVVWSAFKTPTKKKQKKIANDCVRFKNAI